MLNKDKLFVEVGSYQNNKCGNMVCGDCILLKKCIGENRNIAVLSDGLGSGVKANVLSTMTASMATPGTPLQTKYILNQPETV